MELYEKILFWFFPNRCAYCNSLILPEEKRCQVCEKDLNFIGDDICMFCGYKTEHCYCKKHKNEYNGIVAPFYYEGLPKKAIHILKFQKRTGGVSEIAFQISDKIKSAYKGIDFDFITEVPMTKKKVRKRGFNQATLIAKKISKNINKPYKCVLKKTVENNEQHTLSFNRRKGNVVGVYDCVDEYSVKNKNILLIDDVKTSGATLNECAKILKVYGANLVYAATFTVVKNKQKTVN